LILCILEWWIPLGAAEVGVIETGEFRLLPPLSYWPRRDRVDEGPVGGCRS
jgi:hypothetical protein